MTMTPTPATASSPQPISVPNEVDTAVNAALCVFPLWRRTSHAQRGAVLHRVADLVAERRDELARAATVDMGRPLPASLEGVDAAVGAIRQYAELGPVRRGDALLGGCGAMDYVVPEPRGVVAAVTPWNDPVAVPAGILAAAVVMGNTAVFKPSERSPFSGRLLGECFERALPTDVVRTVLGDGSVGRHLTAHPGISTIVHVGSTDTGRAIAQAAAARDTKVVLENGGKDPLIVDSDVDPKWAAAQAALGAFVNAGQLCTSVERIYVLPDVADDFVDALVEAAEHVVLGDPFDPATTMGPLVDSAHREKVHAHVEQAMAAGATVRTGGVVPAGDTAFYPPTVLDHCNNKMLVCSEETFGPVAPVVRVGSFDEALRLAKEGEYGLAASVLSGNGRHVAAAVSELEVGTVKVNAVFGGAPGGSAEPRRASGRGLGFGPELLDELSARKVVHVSPLPE